MKSAVDVSLRVIIIAIFATLVVCVSWQVVSRYVFGTPSVLTDEIARFLFMWLALIGGAYTFGARRHLAIDLLTDSLKGRAKLASEASILTVVAVFAAIVMVWGGSTLVARTLASGQVTPALRISMGWVYGAIPFSGAVIVYYCALFFAEIARGRLPGAEGEVDLPLE
ncbi:TRAP transporter small permease [Roseivivax sediminis]|uniref:TRAP transporter small permease protein n=1 Tax=Roseivivax sediminis TaxID=936889 RepID=A0A1I1YUK1_9RHOB|nr:TRAP transporter small permease [Roseivivax sediminis]SFE23236.1 TRAP-type C4-dicarboxylate transport system, small permease component [Roseivivax sediminis]